MLRFLTAGESHGPSEVAILEGIPASLTLTREDIQKDLDKRRGGAGRGGRGIIEKDQVKILSGVRYGKSLGSPIALMVENLDYNNWKNIMDIKSDESLGAKLIHPPGDIKKPRPGHADLAGVLKYGFDDIRNVLERASARETIMRVAVGAICKKFLLEFGIEIASHTIQIGGVTLQGVPSLTQGHPLFARIKHVYKNDPMIRCIDQITSEKMRHEILQATIKKDTLGGVIEAIAHNVPPGLGSYVHYDRKIDGKLAQALMSIPSVKAVEIGDGFSNASKFGSEVHDEIYSRRRLPRFQGDAFKGYYRKTNRAGGLEGGVTNGQDIVCRVYHKPISTLGNPLNSVDIKTKKRAKALVERSDICVVPRAGVISEAMMAFVLTDAMLEKFGGDSISDIKTNFEGYLKRLSTIFPSSRT